jgi:hypothetical protein
MKFSDKYYITAVIFFVAAVIVIAVPLIFGLSDFTTAVFVVSGVIFTILGAFSIMFSGSETFDPQILGLIPVQSNINLCRITTNYGIAGKAYFLPPRLTGEPTVIQFNPQSNHFDASTLSKKMFSEGKPPGLITVPACNPLVQNLKKNNALVIPERMEELVVLLDEILSNVIGVTSSVSTSIEKSKVTVTLDNYQFFDGCLSSHALSSHCCSKFPCTACSICGTIISESSGNILHLEHCSYEGPRKIAITFSLKEYNE